MLHPSRKYYIITDSATTLLSNFPEGWKESKVENSYSERYKTILRSFLSQELVFYRDGADILKEAYDSFGMDAKCQLRIEEKNDNYGYDLYSLGKIDFTTYVYDPVRESVSITVSDNDDITKLSNRDEITIPTSKTVSIDGDVVTPPTVRDITLQKQNLVKKADFSFQLDGNEIINSDKIENPQFLGSDSPPLTWNAGYLRPPALSGLGATIEHFTVSGVSSGMQTASSAYQDFLVCNNANGAAIDISGFICGAEQAVATSDFTTIQIELSVRLINGGGVQQKIYDFSSPIFTTDGSLNMTPRAIFSEKMSFSCRDGWKIQTRIQCNFTNETYVTTSTPLFCETSVVNYISTQEDDGNDKVNNFDLITSVVNQNDFTDEFTMPSGDDTVIFENKKEYRRNIKIETQDSECTISPFGYGDDDFVVRLDIVHYSEDGLIKDRTILINRTVNSFDEDVFNVNGIDESYSVLRGETIALSSYITTPNDSIGVARMEITSTDIDAVFDDLPPEDSQIEGFLFQDFLNHCMNVIVGENKLIISDDLIGDSRKNQINSAYNLMLLRGSLIRGFSASELPLSASFSEVFEDISKMFDVGMYYDYINERFVIDYMTNIHTDDDSTEHDLGLIDDVQISPLVEEIYKGVKAGNTTDSGIEDFYVKNEGHNDTSYTFPTENASEWLDLRNTISTDATDIEITRRYTKADTEDISRNNDNKLYFLKCYDLTSNVYKSEKTERVSIFNSPTYFADANLLLLPRWILENNSSRVKISFYKKNSTSLIQFQSSTYVIDGGVGCLYDDEEYNEQSDIILSELRMSLARYIAEKVEFNHLQDAELLSVIRENPHRIWKGTDRSGNEYQMYMRNSGGDPLLRESQWEMIKINTDRL